MIYLDNASTSHPKAPGVGAAMAAQVERVPGNPGRGPALEAAALLLEARAAAARLACGGEAGRLVFAKNATEALNAAILGTVGPGDTVAATTLEHNAVMRPLRWLERSRGVRLILVGLDGAGRPDLRGLEAALAARPRLAVLTMASNVTGAIPPWEELALAFKRAGALVCLDASQHAGHRPFPAGAPPFDFLCFPGHKGLLGPTGTGGLYVAGGFLPEPLIRGGTGSRSSSAEQPDELPDRLEAGTQNLAGAAGLLAAALHLEAVGLDSVERRETSLTGRLCDGLSGIPGLRVHGPPPGAPRAPVVSFDSPAAGVERLAAALEEAGVAARAGLHCAPEAHRSIGTFGSGGTVRLSPGPFSREGEIDEAVAAVRAAVGNPWGRTR